MKQHSMNYPLRFNVMSFGQHYLLRVEIKVASNDGVGEYTHTYNTFIVVVLKGAHYSTVLCEPGKM